MKHVSAIEAHSGELQRLRRDIHQHPELGFEVPRTAKIVADELVRLGIEVHTGVGGHGVVGVLRRGNASRSVGLRADMDALPIAEETGADHASCEPQRMHACGHDGHIAILLGAARYLAGCDTLDGTVNFIFQPAEEIFGGARAMAQDGLFDRFPCDTVFGVHNRPGLAVGKFAIRPGAMMAGGARFHIDIAGAGAHAARPEASVDPVLVASHISLALHSIVARNVAPADSAVVSVTMMSAGDTFNVIPASATLGGTARAFSEETMALIEERTRTLAREIAGAFGATATIDFEVLVPPLVNDAGQCRELVAAATDLVGADNVIEDWPLIMASEDFAYMLQEHPGAYMNVGIARGDRGQAQLHSPAYDFNDDAIPYGAALLARIAERKLAGA